MKKSRRNALRCGTIGVGTLATGIGRGDIQAIVGGVNVGDLGLESSAVGKSGSDEVKGHLDERQKRETKQASHLGGVAVGPVCSIAFV